MRERGDKEGGEERERGEVRKEGKRTIKSERRKERDIDR